MSAILLLALVLFAAVLVGCALAVARALVRGGR
jgi:hypothetical protein